MDGTTFMCMIMQPNVNQAYIATKGENMKAYFTFIDFPKIDAIPILDASAYDEPVCSFISVLGKHEYIVLVYFDIHKHIFLYML